MAVHVEKSTLTYHALKPGQTRFLKLTSTANLIFWLETRSLDDGFKYHALSYTWGDVRLTEKIEIDGCTVPVTENLYLALIHLLHGIEGKRVKYPLSTYFWIDSLCINQADNAERSVQVQRMAQIFSTAAKVYVWLGVPADVHQNRIAWRRLRTIANQFIQKRHEALPQGWRYFQTFDAAASETRIVYNLAQKEVEDWSNPESQPQDAWCAFKHIWASNLWHRAWVSVFSEPSHSQRALLTIPIGVSWQEGTVHEPTTRLIWKGISTPKSPKTIVKFVCGNLSFTSHNLSVALILCDYLIKIERPGTDMLKGSAAAFARMSAIRRYRHQTGDADPLDVLSRFRAADCMDPRDHVYACLSLLPLQIQKLIVPDYSHHVVQVYQNVSERLSAVPHKNLNFLGYAMMPAPDWFENNPKDVQWKCLPSWMPNWSLRLDFAPLPKLLSLQGDWDPWKFLGSRMLTLVDRRALIQADTVKEIPAYNACGRFNQCQFSIEGPVFETPGYKFDVISEVQTWRNPMSLLQPVMKQWRDILQECGTYPEPSQFDSDLSRVQLADVQYKALPDPKVVRRGYGVNNSVLLKPDSEPTSEELVEKSSMQMTQRIISKGRALTRTEQGFLALVPYSSLPDDAVCMFFGGQVVYVLRPNKDSDGADTGTHTYVGEAYVHNLMDGELSRFVDELDVPVQHFSLV